MKKGFLMLLAVCAVFAFSNCKKDYLVKNTGTVTGNIRDVANNQYLGNVLATLVIDKNTMYKDSTDSTGYFSIPNVPTGEYAIVYSKEGYATIRTSITVYDPELIANTTSGNKQSTNTGLFQSVQMYPLIGKATGTVTLYGVPAANITVTAFVRPYSELKATSATSSYAFEPYSFTATTNANGVYTFSNLPLLSYASIVATSGKASGSSYAYLGQESITRAEEVENIDMNENSLVLINYSGKGGALVDTTTQITLTFSENVSEEITKAKGGSVILYNGEDEVLTTVTYSNNQITISPISGFLVRNVYYTVSYDVYSTATKNLNDNFSFKTKAPAASLTTPTITYDVTNGIRVTVASIATKISGSISYELWYKSNTSADFTLNSSFSFTTAPYQVKAYGDLTSGSYYVVAKATGLDGIEVKVISSLVTVTKP